MTKREAKMYNIGERAWYELLRSGRIKSIRIGRKFVVPRACFLSWYNTAGSNEGDGNAS